MYSHSLPLLAPKMPHTVPLLLCPKCQLHPPPRPMCESLHSSLPAALPVPIPDVLGVHSRETPLLEALDFWGQRTRLAPDVTAGKVGGFQLSNNPQHDSPLQQLVPRAESTWLPAVSIHLCWKWVSHSLC